MNESRIHVPYNCELKALEELLVGVRRPGDFFAQGSFEGAMPRIEVDGVGVISFPVPESQVEQLIGQAGRAPYGRGTETIVDTSVRQVWQVTPAKVHVGGKSWDKTFGEILGTVKRGLGCEDIEITVELYKLLIYDHGGFFTAHRDTEKADGMFGTLVVVLPSFHRGGDLVIRHAGREVMLGLSGADVSELKIAAFYADCEHEVRPITQGNRVCLIYNLIQRPVGTSNRPLKAPLYAGETSAAAKTLKDAFAQPDAPSKLVWLLRHQYSPAGVSFSGLKGEDAALSKVVCAAAEKAGCSVHLAIVHIEESGAAQPDYQPYRRSRWRGYHDEETEAEDTDNFEVIEVSDSSRYMADWRTLEDHPANFGKLPLLDNEVLPQGILDDEKPDDQRLMEATGNEGASFERSYHRAGLVLWPSARFLDVLLSAGVRAALPYFKDRFDAMERTGAVDREALQEIAARIIDKWEASSSYPSSSELGHDASRSEMVQLLTRVGDASLVARFIAGVLISRYDGSENPALLDAVKLLTPHSAAEVLTAMARESVRYFPKATCELLAALRVGLGSESGWNRALSAFASEVIDQLPNLQSVATGEYGAMWWRARNS